MYINPEMYITLFCTLTSKPDIYSSFRNEMKKLLLSYQIKELDVLRFLSRFTKPVIFKQPSEELSPTISEIIKKSMDYLDTYKEDFQSENYFHLTHYLNDTKLEALKYNSPREKLLSYLQPTKRNW